MDNANSYVEADQLGNPDDSSGFEFHPESITDFSDDENQINSGVSSHGDDLLIDPGLPLTLTYKGDPDIRHSRTDPQMMGSNQPQTVTGNDDNASQPETVHGPENQVNPGVSPPADDPLIDSPQPLTLTDKGDHDIQHSRTVHPQMTDSNEPQTVKENDDNARQPEIVHGPGIEGDVNVIQPLVPHHHQPHQPRQIRRWRLVLDQFLNLFYFGLLMLLALFVKNYYMEYGFIRGVELAMGNLIVVVFNRVNTIDYHPATLRDYATIYWYSKFTHETKEGYESLIGLYQPLLGSNFVTSLDSSESWASRRERSYILCLMAHSYHQLYRLDPYSSKDNVSYYDRAERYYLASEELYNEKELRVYDSVCRAWLGDLYISAGKYQNAYEFYHKVYKESKREKIWRYWDWKPLIMQRIWAASIQIGRYDEAVEIITLLNINNPTNVTFDVSRALHFSYYAKQFNAGPDTSAAERADLTSHVINYIKHNEELQPDKSIFDPSKTYFDELLEVAARFSSNRQDPTKPLDGNTSLGLRAYQEGNYSACITHQEELLRHLQYRERNIAPQVKQQIFLTLAVSYYDKANEENEFQHMKDSIMWYYKAEEQLYRRNPENFEIQNYIQQQIARISILYIHHAPEDSNFINYQILSAHRITPLWADDSIISPQYYFTVDHLLENKQYNTASGVIYRILEQKQLREQTRLRIEYVWLKWLGTFSSSMQTGDCQAAENIGERIHSWIRTITNNDADSLYHQCTLYWMLTVYLSDECNDCCEPLLSLTELVISDAETCYMSSSSLIKHGNERLSVLNALRVMLFQKLGTRHTPIYDHTSELI